MNQRVSHSNLPKFNANKSQTSEILYQQPTAGEMKTPALGKAKNFAHNLIAVALVIGCISSPIYMIRGCADDVDRQHAQAVQYQAQFGVSK
ncbi:hypothetical protein [Acinetobacter tianfuensis]|uniref:Uncharacterized protein n=1 Tax=Acinetobacter tianfuensis TaxID=2419603 RepID=A0A3A8E9Y3_9GAMM|nr:hypothetical protein [Acinetobacter tianfuensis]RKG31465.1 hypothetical protein D7V32_08350 [Acinetobacter tianfuensis]